MVLPYFLVSWLLHRRNVRYLWHVATLLPDYALPCFETAHCAVLVCCAVHINGGTTSWPLNYT